MSKDGLLPPVFSRLHPKFNTPAQSTLLLGVFIAVFAGFVPIAVVGEMTSIGTLLAFVMVCLGVLIMRKSNPDAPRPFRTPWVPVVPVLGIVVCLVMMASLPWETWLRLLLWLALGLVIYYGYGRKHSKLRLATTSPPDSLSAGKGASG